MTIAVIEATGAARSLARVVVSSADPKRIRELSVRLDACGYATVPVGAGTRALRIVREVLPDLVVVNADEDIGAAMALAEGVKHCDETRHVPVVMQAMYADATFRRGCLAAGIDDVITGGVSNAILAARLAPLFRLATMTAELHRRRQTMHALGLAEGAKATIEPDVREPRVLFLNSGLTSPTGSTVELVLAADCGIAHSADAFEAAESLSSSQFDALVVVPEDEIERTLHLCAHIRNNPRLFNLPVLIVARREQFADVETCYSRGASIVLHRPFDPTELRDHVLSLVRRQRVRQAIHRGLSGTLVERTADAASGLYSKAFSSRHLSRLISNAGLSQKPVSLVLFDLQNIAWFERQYGGGSGDRVVNQVSRWIAGLIRAEDMAARLGESIVAVILPDTGAHEAQFVANRIEGVLLNTDFSLKNSVEADPLRVWVGTGIATAEAGDTVDGLIARAKSQMR
ncbi:MAG TPA: diguanylate cyclase [Alphaproteobacteria bacterium]|nr:diguanylate cyclase [Alphaproteobacteria bacterium]